MPLTLLIAVCTAPFLVQGLLMVVDEFYFHRARGLSQWEVLGHPLDTITVACALCFLLLAKPNVTNLIFFGVLSTFSCLFVTKDEFVHQEACEPLEHWLHAVLFLLHPVVFFAAGTLWWQGAGLYPLRVQTAVVAAFGLYQLLYWRNRAAEKTR